MKKEVKIKTSESIKITFFLNIIFSILEIVGGLLTSSMALISNAVNEVGDITSIGISYLFENKSKKEPDKDYSYGYSRYSLLGSLITTIVLIIGSIIVLFKAIPRLVNPVSINVDAIIIFSIFGFLINAYAALTLKNPENSSINIKKHLFKDTLFWIIILLGNIAIKVWDISYLDSLLSILIAAYMIIIIFKTLIKIFNIFMQKVPSGINIDKIKEEIEKNVLNINNIHNIHIWSMDGEVNYMTAHIEIKDNLLTNDLITIKNQVNEILIKNKIENVTLEFEYKSEKCKYNK